MCIFTCRLPVFDENTPRYSNVSEAESQNRVTHTAQIQGGADQTDYLLVYEAN